MKILSHHTINLFYVEICLNYTSESFTQLIMTPTEVQIQIKQTNNAISEFLLQTITIHAIYQKVLVFGQWIGLFSHALMVICGTVQQIMPVKLAFWCTII